MEVGWGLAMRDYLGSNLIWWMTNFEICVKDSFQKYLVPFYTSAGIIRVRDTFWITIRVFRRAVYYSRHCNICLYANNLSLSFRLQFHLQSLSSCSHHSLFGSLDEQRIVFALWQTSSWPSLLLSSWQPLPRPCSRHVRLTVTVTVQNVKSAIGHIQVRPSGEYVAQPLAVPAVWFWPDHYKVVWKLC